MTATILLVDDHPVFRQGLYHLLAPAKDLEVVGEADDGQIAVEQVRRLHPDLVVMDINMPNLDGIKATRQIMTESPDTRIVALSVHSGKRFVREMIQAGASGYILKESIPEEMVEGIRTVLSGEVYLSQSISKKLVSDYRTLITESGVDSNEPSQSILYTKLHPPAITANIIPRVRLIEAMEKGAQNTMTLIAAPAGYGKSIVASQWQEVSRQKVAWVSLDEGDNDLRLFLSYVLEAVGLLFPDTAFKSKSMIKGVKIPNVEIISQLFLNDIDSCVEPFAVVLDDYHLINREEIHEFISRLLLHPSPAMHLILITRRDPPLSLSSLRAHGKLNEIVQDDLCFKTDEIKAYLERFLRVSISDKTAQILESKVEGWVTGLHLAALSMQSGSDHERIISGLEGTSQYVYEYLVQEVLSKAPPAVNRLLLQTAVLNRFCASLCDALMSSDAALGPDGREITGREFILWLNKMHFFTISLDGDRQWFRYHHLFQQLLEDRLKSQEPAEVISDLNSTASAWFEQHQYVDDAIRHAVAAKDMKAAARIVEQNRQAILNQDKWYILEKWMSMLSEDIIHQEPGLLLARAWLLYHNFAIASIPPLVDAADELIHQSKDNDSLRGEVNFFRGYFNYFQNHGNLSLKHLTRALEQTPAASHEIRGQIEILLGLVLQMLGKEKKATDNLHEALHRLRPEEGLIKTRLLASLVYIYILAGRLDKAFPVVLSLNEVAEKRGYLYAKQWGAYLQGLIHFYRNEVEDAIDCYTQALEHKHMLHSRAVIDSMAGLMIAYHAKGKMDKAEDMLSHLSGYAESLDDQDSSVVIWSCKARLSMLQDEKRAASLYLSSVPPPSENMIWWMEIPAVTYCRALIDRGGKQALENGEKLLKQFLQMNKDNHNVCQQIQIMPLLSLVYCRQKRFNEAMKILKHAVKLAEPGGWIRPFCEGGSFMVDMLEEMRKQKFAAGFIMRLIDSIRGGQPAEPAATPPALVSEEPPPKDFSAPQALIEPLTNRELDVLEFLEKRYQNKEIAEKLFISTETVKGHLKNIYQKMSVGGRREAVLEAKRLKII